MPYHDMPGHWTGAGLCTCILSLSVLTGNRVHVPCHHRRRFARLAAVQRAARQAPADRHTRRTGPS